MAACSGVSFPTAELWRSIPIRSAEDAEYRVASDGGSPGDN
jgi:hypothetical protein